MRERVRQVWLPDGEPEDGVWPRWKAACLEWWERETVQALVSRMSLQAALSAGLLAVCVALRFIPLTALQPAQDAVRRAFTRDYTVSAAWADARSWAAARGGWAPALAGLYESWRERVTAVVSWISPATGGGEAAGPAAQANDPAGGLPAAETATPDPPGGINVPPGTAAAPAGGGDPTAGQTDPNQTAGIITWEGGGQTPARVKPVPGPVISPFGWRGKAGEEEYHQAVDLQAETGAPVRAMQAGTVLEAGEDPQYGAFVTVDHGSELATRYAPLRNLQVKPGDPVTAGQVLGELAGAPPGEPGQVHLHFEVLSKGKQVNPVPFLGSEGGV